MERERESIDSGLHTIIIIIISSFFSKLTGYKHNRHDASYHRDPNVLKHPTESLNDPQLNTE